MIRFLIIAILSSTILVGCEEDCRDCDPEPISQDFREKWVGEYIGDSHCILSVQGVIDHFYSVDTLSVSMDNNNDSVIKLVYRNDHISAQMDNSGYYYHESHPVVWQEFTLWEDSIAFESSDGGNGGSFRCSFRGDKDF